MIMLCLGASSLRWTSLELSQNFRPSKHGSAVWVGSFAWLVKISTLSLFLHFNSFCCSDCDDNALLGCFVSSVDEPRIISKLSSFKTWVGSLGRQFRLAGKNQYSQPISAFQLVLLFRL